MSSDASENATPAPVGHRHSPAPWRWTEDREDQIPCLVDANDHRVFDVNVGFDFNAKVVFANPVNKALLQSAPALLEALEECVSLLFGAAEEDASEGEGYRLGYYEAITRARAAIAAATTEGE